MSRLAARRLGVLLIAGVLATGVLATAPAAAADYPRVLSVRADHPPQVSLDVVVPPMLADRTLPASAFEVIDRGQRVPVRSATRLTPSPLRVMLVLDTTVPAAALAAQQGAAREFLFGLPAQAQVGVVAGSPDPVVAAPPSTNREAAVRALVELEPEPADSAVDVTPALGSAIDELEPSGGANVVVVVDSRPAGETVPYEVSRAALDAGTAVYALLLKPGPRGYLGGLPALSGGRVLNVTGPGMLLTAFDTVRLDLSGRYRVDYSAAGPPGRTAQLAVAADGIRQVTSFAVGEAAEPTAGDDAPPLAPIAGALLAILACAVLVGRLATPVTSES